MSWVVPLIVGISSWLGGVSMGVMTAVRGSDDRRDIDDDRFRAAQEQVNELYQQAYQQKIDFNRLKLQCIGAENELKKLKEERKKEKNETLTLEELNIKNPQHMLRIIEICQSIPPTPLPINAVGLFGKSGAGKSKILTSATGRPGLFKSGRNQTTMKIESHIVNNVVYLDIPGFTDRISFLSVMYISVLKALKFIGIVVERTIDEVLDLCLSLEQLSIRYFIIVNKCDDPGVDEEEGGIDNFKKKFKAEVIKHSLWSINIKNDIYFISARQPKAPELDWESLIERIEKTVGRENFYDPSKITTNNATTTTNNNNNDDDDKNNNHHHNNNISTGMGTNNNPQPFPRSVSSLLNDANMITQGLLFEEVFEKKK